ncbi:helix-turn-helix domain-containing protein [Haloferax sp. YSMS24]|uniref:helix-turn-helix domain-containing protein n=1 Tax=Haloferax sp. YSMS24 TaxID=3388425 RepID=UPI00398D261B
MDCGVHGEIEVSDPCACRISQISIETDVRSITRSSPKGSDAVSIEFSADKTVDDSDIQEIFHHGNQTVYRFECQTESGPGCACEYIEDHGCPVRHIDADNNNVVLSFFAPDLDSLREIIVELKSEFDGVSLRRLTQSDGPGSGSSPVYVDRDALTSRQQEVLATAHEMGYFEHPRTANATQVADELGINRSTFAEHLSAAQSKLLDAILDY